MRKLDALRMKIALWLMPEFEKFLHDEAMSLHQSLCLNFGGRAVRELLRPEGIVELKIYRDDKQWRSEVLH